MLVNFLAKKHKNVPISVQVFYIIDFARINKVNHFQCFHMKCSVAMLFRTYIISQIINLAIDI